MEELIVWLDDKLVPQSEAKVSVYDHGFLYGDGIFETLRVYKGKVFRWHDHLQRLFQSAKTIYLALPWSEAELTEAVEKTLLANKIEEGSVRLTVSRGVGPLGLSPKLCPQPTLVIMAKHFTPYPAEYREKGVSVAIVPTRRNHPDALQPSVKSMNFLNNIIAKIEAAEKGAFEGIMLNQEGYLTEGAVSNFFLVRENTLLTPPLSAGLLAGVTRQVVLECAKNLHISVEETNLTWYDFYNAKEAFLTNSSLEVMPINKVDEQMIANGLPGEITKKLQQEYQNFIL